MKRFWLVNILPANTEDYVRSVSVYPYPTVREA